MAHKPNSVFLPERMPNIDIEGCEMRCLPGKCAILMDGHREQSGSILLPDKSQGMLRPDVGRVIDACGPKSSADGSLQAIGVKRGDYVLVRGYDGAWFNDYHQGRQLRLLGRARSEEGDMVFVPWDESILAIWNGKAWAPAGRNYLVKRMKKQHDLMPGELAPWEDWGYVMGGPEDGKRIHFHPEGPEDLVYVEFANETDLWIVHKSYVQLEVIA